MPFFAPRRGFRTGLAVTAVLASALVASPATAATTYTLVTQPAGGHTALFTLITSAKTSIDLTM
ncbi:hypothetical protein [Fodinicola feengrottensis]|nr:hypothetical protein [Fodinicola feengrottensis]